MVLEWKMNYALLRSYSSNIWKIWKKVSKVTDGFHFIVAVVISLFFYLTCSIIITIIGFFLSTPSFRISNTCPINSQLSCPSAAKLPLVLFFLKARFFVLSSRPIKNRARIKELTIGIWKNNVFTFLSIFPLLLIIQFVNKTPFHVNIHTRANVQHN